MERHAGPPGKAKAGKNVSPDGHLMFAEFITIKESRTAMESSLSAPGKKNRLQIPMSILPE
jgi:hypothetical protein